ncbi:hypothetical protein JTE90_007532 [Oedothorax gibbosus]|uniref:Uncharacterized protein n=1 Tax=Oedothorax gibbosus TaxID=931172 RepID=A0AAV6VMA3_9ARAC|nr:hypothetical protein JTE90_007532 [Oedothorax gibbosus]
MPKVTLFGMPDPSPGNLRICPNLTELSTSGNPPDPPGLTHSSSVTSLMSENSPHLTLPHRSLFPSKPSAHLPGCPSLQSGSSSVYLPPAPMMSHSTKPQLRGPLAALSATGPLDVTGSLMDPCLSRSIHQHKQVTSDEAVL